MELLDQRMRSIIKTIRHRREELSYSQEYMAAKMEIGQNCYSKIELGHTKITLDRLFEICEILDLDVIDMLSFY